MEVFDDESIGLSVEMDVSLVVNLRSSVEQGIDYLTKSSVAELRSCLAIEINLL